MTEWWFSQQIVKIEVHLADAIDDCFKDVFIYFFIIHQNPPAAACLLQPLVMLFLWKKD